MDKMPVFIAFQAFPERHRWTLKSNLTVQGIDNEKSLVHPPRIPFCPPHSHARSRRFPGLLRASHFTGAAPSSAGHPVNRFLCGLRDIRVALRAMEKFVGHKIKGRLRRGLYPVLPLTVQLQTAKI